jgi:filamentous hemagglutinin family protein
MNPPVTLLSPRVALMASTVLQAGAMALVAGAALAQPAPNARPIGGTVVAGTASISRSVANTRIDQATPRAAINWQSFNVGSQQSVTFVQPSSTAMTLNRVVGPDPSQIAGRIDANGRIVLVNQAGVVFYKGSQVNAAGLVASAAGISTRNFMAGQMVFDEPAQAGARVENAGNITIGQAGLAALVAPEVRNSGVINAKLGHVVLAGAKTATLDLYGDGLLSLDVTNAVTRAPTGGGGQTSEALVTNTGTILADGGTVQLTARAADGIVQNLVENGGRIRAASVGDKTGTVVLNAVGGSIVIDGQLSATGEQPATKGGAIEATATGNVTVKSGAVIDASGRAGGGVVALGTTLERARRGPSAPSTQTARNVTVQAGAHIKADATGSGQGGRVVLLSGDTTHMNGDISARGGPHGGAGGFIEVSGTHLGITGSLDAAAPSGTQGTVLLDPVYLDIVAGNPSGAPGSEDGNFFTNGGTVFANDGNTATPDTLSTSVFGQFSGNVLLEAQRTITVAAPFTVGNGATTSVSLTLEAGQTITVLNGASITASGDIVFAIVPSLGPGTTSPLISILAPVTSTNGSVSLLTSPGGTINVAAPGGVFSTSGPRVSLQADQFNITGPVSAGFGTVELAPATQRGTMTVGGSGLSLTPFTGGAIQLGAVTLGGVLTTTAGAITLAGPIELGDNANSLGLFALGPVRQTGGPLSVFNVYGATSGAGGDFALVDPGNSIFESSGIRATNGNVVLVDGADLVLTGLFSGTNLFFEVASAGGRLSLGGGDFGQATLNAASGGRVSLVADAIVDASRSRITASGGTVELSPFSPINASLLGTTGLVVNAGLLGNITTSTLAVGGFTDVPAGATVAAPRASSVSVDATADLSGVVSTLQLLSQGPITQPGGPITVGTLSGIGGAWSLTNSGNAIGALGNILANSFDLIDSIDLAVVGSVGPNIGTNAATFSLTAPDISIPGTLSDGGDGAIDLVATVGAIDESGTLVAGTLTGSAIGAVNLTDASPYSNRVARLGNFTASSLALNDGTNLLLAGLLNAGAIVIRAPGAQISLGNGATIETGGTASLQAASFAQSGASTLLGRGGAPATLRIDVSGGAQFDPTAGLQAAGNQLILTLVDGTASGNVIVGALDVSYTTPGAANLTGAIGDVSGPSAASLGTIQPSIDPRYLFNGCVIGAPICSPLQAVLRTPVPLPNLAQASMLIALQDFTREALVTPSQRDDLLQLPVVSQRDY